MVSGWFGVALSLQASGELVQRERSLGLRSLSLPHFLHPPAGGVPAEGPSGGVPMPFVSKIR